MSRTNSITGIRDSLVPTPGPLSTPCLVWPRAKSSGGYGQVSFQGRAWRVHVLMWTDRNEPKPLGMQLDHLCRVRACANTDHLELVTPRENTLRGLTITAANSVKVACPLGHPYDTVNTYRDARGRRSCKECVREAKRRYRARIRGAAA